MDKNQKGFNFTALFIAAYVIIAIIIIVIIWWPKGSKKENKIIGYENINSQEKEINLYMDELNRLLKPENSKELFSKMDSKYLNKNLLNNNNFEEFLSTSHLTANQIYFIEKSVSKQSNNTYTFKFTYRANGITRHVNVLEISPYNYTITFDISDIPIANKDSFITTVDNVTFNVKQVGISDTGISYKLEMINDSTSNVNYNFNSIDNVLLELKNGNTVKLSSAIVNSGKESLNPNSKITKEFFFPVGNTYQENIKSLNLRNIKIGENTKTIVIDL